MRLPKAHAPSLPRVPSPKRIVAWFRARRRRRQILVRLTLLVIAAALLSIVARPASHRIKAWQSRRLAAQALVLIEQEDWTEAVEKVQTSFWLSQTQPETWRASALLLTRTAQSALAVEWWQKFAQSRPLSIEDHRNYADAALSARELIIASAQIDLLLTQQAGPTPRDLLLAGQLATLRGYSSYAVGYAERILGDVSSDSRERLGANLLVLANRPVDSPMYAKASENLLNIARDETNRASAQALAVLAQQRLPGLTNPVAKSLSISLPDVSNKAISLNEIADRLARNPNSRPFHQMLALELHARAEPARTDELIARAIQSYGDEDDETLVALGSWLYSHSRFESMLGVLPLERAARRRELLMERIDAMAALGRLAEVKELLLREYPVLAQAFQHMYLAVVSARLGETTAAANEWYRALDTAESPQTLIGLADYAEKNGALGIADAAYARLITIQPALKEAYILRLQLTEARGETAKARTIATEIIKLWPEDIDTRIHEIYLRLLLAGSGLESKTAETQAEAFVSQNPWDGSARTTLALARLREGKAAAALNALTEFTPEVPSSAVSQAVYAAALAANGWQDKARAEAEKLATIRLLPEERALIAPLLSEKP
jgi:Tfp pilus assembly protein PilF